MSAPESALAYTRSCGALSRDTDPGISGDEARLLVIATLANDKIIADAEELARDLFDDWDTQHRDQIEELNDTGRLEFEQIDEHATSPASAALLCR